VEEVIKPTDIDLARTWTFVPTFLQNKSDYVIRINEVGIRRAFSLITRKGMGNEYDDNIPEGQYTEVTVCSINLEDMIKFQQIKFKVLGGYFYDSGTELVFKEFVTEPYELMKKHKTEHNPREAVEKLILNSVYDKTIQNPITSNCFFPTEKNRRLCQLLGSSPE
jgi:hypothetical protein